MYAVFRLHGNEPAVGGEIAAEAILPGGQGGIGSSGGPECVDADKNWSVEHFLEVENHFVNLSKEIFAASFAFTAKVGIV